MSFPFTPKRTLARRFASNGMLVVAFCSTGGKMLDEKRNKVIKKIPTAKISSLLRLTENFRDTVALGRALNSV